MFRTASPYKTGIKCCNQLPDDLMMIAGRPDLGYLFAMSCVAASATLVALPTPPEAGQIAGLPLPWGEKRDKLYHSVPVLEGNAGMRVEYNQTNGKDGGLFGDGVVGRIFLPRGLVHGVGQVFSLWIGSHL